MKALLLAAGEGRRMRPLTLIYPKPCVPVGGVPLAVRQMAALRAAGITDVVMNVAYGSRVARGLLGDGKRFGVNLRYSVEGTCAESSLETLGGIVHALPLLEDSQDDAFLVVAGDILTDFDYRCLVARGRSLAAENLDAHLVLVPNPNYHAAGDMGINEKGRVCRTPRTHTFSSLGVYRTSLFKGLSDQRASLFPWLWQAVEAGRVSGEIWNGAWFNVGDSDELRTAEQYLLAKQSEKNGKTA